MTNWFLLGALWVAMYFFNGNIPVSQTVKTTVNWFAIAATAVLAFLAVR